MNRPNDDLERRLRATLDTHARQAPPGEPLAHRILLEVDAPVLRPRRGWRTWSAPLLAAAAIVAAALVMVGLNNAHLGAPPAAPGTKGISHEPTPVRQPTSRPAPERTTTTAPNVTPPPSVRTANTGGVRAFRASNITFDSQTEGWALGSARCVSGPGRCTEILHTTDGINWLAAPKGESFNVLDVNGCADPCVTNLRFANATVGYAYGPDALFMTTDGGAHWKQQDGLGADALETVDGNVVLVRADGLSTAVFRRALVGSSTWTPFTIPGFHMPAGGSAQLTRAHGVTLLTVTGYDPAKVTSSRGALYRSTDGGASWRKLKWPCGVQSAGYHDSIAAGTVASGDGSLAVDCAVQSSADPVGFGSTVSATPGTTHFVSPFSGGKVTPASLIASPSDSVQLVVENSTGRTYRSDDTGNSWTPVSQLKGVTFVGFESATVGRALGNNGRSVWTTTDAGATWSEVLFPA